MKKIDRSLFGTLLFLFGGMAIPLLNHYGYLSMTSKTMLLSTGMMLVGIYLWFMGMISQSDSVAEPAKKSS